MLDTKPVGLSVEPPAEAPRLAEATTSRLAQPDPDPWTPAAWEEQTLPDLEAEAEGDAFESVTAPEDEFEPEPELQAPDEPGDDAQPEAQTLPFEFD